MKKLWLTVGLIAFLLGLIVIALVENIGAPSEPEYHEKKLNRWLEDLDEPSALTRTNAALAIRQMGTNAVPFLIQTLYAKDSRLKLNCVYLLKRQHWVDFHFHSDRQKRSDAVRGLMILGPEAKAAIPALADLLKNGNLGEGQMAVLILSRVGRSAVPALEVALTNSNERVRYEAAEALGNVAEPSSVSNLLIVLKDPDWMTRSSAAMALRQFPKQANVIVPALVNCLDDTDGMFAGNVADTLGTFGPNARPAFPKLLKSVASTNDNLSQSAIEALMKIDPDRTFAAFTNNLESPDARVRTSTAWALVFFGPDGEPAVPFLVKCLKDSDAGVRENAAFALRQIAADPDLVVPALMANLNDPNPEARVTTAIALGSFGARSKSAIPKILKIIQENKGDELTVGELYDALSEIDPTAAAKLNAK